MFKSTLQCIHSLTRFVQAKAPASESACFNPRMMMQLYSQMCNIAVTPELRTQSRKYAELLDFVTQTCANCSSDEGRETDCACQQFRMACFALKDQAAIASRALRTSCVNMRDLFFLDSQTVRRDYYLASSSLRSNQPLMMPECYLDLLNVSPKYIAEICTWVQKSYEADVLRKSKLRQKTGWTKLADYMDVDAEHELYRDLMEVFHPKACEMPLDSVLFSTQPQATISSAYVIRPPCVHSCSRIGC